MKIFAWFLLLLVTSYDSPFTDKTAADSTEAFEVSGVVGDIDGARLTNALLSFQTPRRRLSVMSSTEGSYKITLKSGTYKVAVYKMGFCPYRRGPFTAAKTQVKMNFLLLPCPLADKQVVDHTGGVKGEVAQYVAGFQTEDLGPFAPSLHKWQILFGTKEQDGPRVRFTSPSVNGRTSQVVLAYDLSTIYADSVTFERNANRAVAQGHVKFEDGETSIVAQRLQIDPFPSGIPKIAVLE